MIITIDGNNGAGKTTQEKVLAAQLNLNRYDELCIHLWNHLDWIIQISPLQESRTGRTRLFAALQVYHSLPDRVIVPRFWNTILRYLHRDPDELNAFRQCLSFGGTPEPAASFYLHVPFHVSKTREFRRHSPPDTAINVSPSDDEDNRLLKPFRWLENQLPYFHIIDGTMPIEAVTAAMLEKINQSS